MNSEFLSKSTMQRVTRLPFRIRIRWQCGESGRHSRRQYFIVPFALLLICTTIPAIQAVVPHLTESDLLEGLRKIRNMSGLSIPDSQLSDIVQCTKTCPNETQQLITREVIIRFNLRTHDEPCDTADPTLQDMILNPPNPIFLVVPAYLKWQETILDSRLKFCNPLQNLGCNPDSLKCSCSRNLAWKSGFQPAPVLGSPGPTYDTCAIPAGESCVMNATTTLDYEYEYSDPPTEYYDPLIALFSPSPHVSPFPLECDFNQVGESCHKPTYGIGPVCWDQRLLTKSDALDISFEGITKSTHGQPCNFAANQKLYTYPEWGTENYAVRLTALQSLRNTGNRFCDLRKLLICADLSSTCDCIHPGTQNQTSSRCQFPPEYNQCEMTGDLGMIFEGKNFVEFARVNIMQGFHQLVPICPGRFICHQDGGVPAPKPFCTCPAGQAGENCDKQLTGFIGIMRPSAFATDEPDRAEKLRSFEELNVQAIRFEEKLTNQGALGAGVRCDFNKDIKVRRTVGRIRTLNNLGTTAAMTKADYQNLTMTVSSLAEDGGSNYCRRDVKNMFGNVQVEGLECSPSESCWDPRAPVDRQSIQELTKLLLTFEVLKCNETCFPEVDPAAALDLPEGVVLLDTEQRRETWDILDHFRHIGARFCNVKAGLTCRRLRLPPGGADVDQDVTGTGTCACVKEEAGCCDAAEQIIDLGGGNSGQKVKSWKIGQQFGILAAVLSLGI